MDSRRFALLESILVSASITGTYVLKTVLQHITGAGLVHCPYYCPPPHLAANKIDLAPGSAARVVTCVCTSVSTNMPQRVQATPKRARPSGTPREMAKYAALLAQGLPRQPGLPALGPPTQRPLALGNPTPASPVLGPSAQVPQGAAPQNLPAGSVAPAGMSGLEGSAAAAPVSEEPKAGDVPASFPVRDAARANWRVRKLRALYSLLHNMFLNIIHIIYTYYTYYVETNQPFHLLQGYRQSV